MKSFIKIVYKKRAWALCLVAVVLILVSTQIKFTVTPVGITVRWGRLDYLVRQNFKSKDLTSISPGAVSGEEFFSVKDVNYIRKHFKLNLAMKERFDWLHECFQKKIIEPKDMKLSSVSAKKLVTEWIKSEKLSDYTKKGIEIFVANRPKSLILTKQTELPVISICMGLTTRGLSLNIKNIFNSKRFVLFSRTLPGYLKYLENGFEYWFVISYDIGDPILDNKANLASIYQWFNKHIAVPAKRKANVIMQLNMLNFHNKPKKPGPAFNFALHSAYEDGSDYFYRTNDDTIPRSKWALEFVSTLTERDPPNFGVVGPTHEGTKMNNMRILTHDFTHRTHFKIFRDSTYYPVVFSDWYMDDWISHIYCDRYTKQIKNVVVEHAAGKPRYAHNRGSLCLLEMQINHGDSLIKEYLKVNHKNWF